MTSSYSIYFRPIDPSDRNVVQELHEEWFPIRYHDSFYESIIQNNVYDGYPLYTCVASAIRSNINLDNSSYSEDIESPSCDQGIDESIVKDAWGQHWKSLHIDSLYDLPILFKHSVKPLASNRERASSDRYDERIVGCLIGRFIHNPSEENKSLLLSHSPTYRHTTLFYIMTLGVADDFRNLGLATELIQRCIHLALHVSSCGAIYLHVITYNTGAIQFYEKLGFRRIKEVQGWCIRSFSK